MAFNRRNFKSELTTGFGSSANTRSGRFYRKDGTVNIQRRGVPFLDRFSPFHTMLSMSRWKFWCYLIGFYVSINVLFAFIYYLIGVEHLNGSRVGISKFGQFIEGFFFSAQTFTTVGYGHVSPDGVLVSSVAAFESFLGVMSLALASGIFFGRFSMPRAYLRFSNVALLSPFKEGQALMFRVVPERNTQLTEAEVKVTLAYVVREGDMERNEFFNLTVEFSKINSLVLNWTIVHPVNEESPLYGYTLKELDEMEAEIWVFLKAYDEVFANSVIARTSYTADEIIPNARFRPMYHSDGDATVLDVDKLNDFDLLPKI
jgi:inward rectifier potassium channel